MRAALGDGDGVGRALKVCGAVLELGGGDGRWSCGGGKINLARGCVSLAFWVTTTFVSQRIRMIMIMY